MKRHRRPPPRTTPSTLDRLCPDDAGIDCGSAEHFVAVPPDRDPQPVRTFAAFTGDLYRLADWLHDACVADQHDVPGFAEVDGNTGVKDGVVCYERTLQNCERLHGHDGSGGRRFRRQLQTIPR